ncbi:MAG TPA: ParB/RepB/Spo0J family partition protein [Dehalococcoidia bacterium]|nr:ParB/RepB/Spo0J family partition protein [Dehalococcoidia bacterium]
MTQNRRSLGRGLDALLGPSSRSSQEERLEASGETQRGVDEIDVDLISSNPEQPRSRFESGQLQELAESIREHGILQPLLVTRDRTGSGYRLIAGERRLQAARQAGLSTVPIVVREAADSQLLELALVENIQRADLNPIEEAMAYRRLVDEYGQTQEEVAKRVGKSRAAVANSLRLLALEPEIRRSLVTAEISEGHARALLAVSGNERLAAWQTVISRRLSVRETETLVRRILANPTDSMEDDAPGRRSPDPTLTEIEAKLRRALSTRVTVRRQKRGARITIDCYSREELDGVLETLLGEHAE